MRIRVWSWCVLLFSGLFISNASIAESSVWKVSKDGKYFYVGGTVHLLSPNDHPLPSEYAEAYTDSDVLVFETDINEAGSLAFQQKSIAAMTYSDGRTLNSALDDNTYKKLSDYLTSRGIPINNFSKFEPWGVSLVITVIEYQRLGMSPEFGVEEYFNKLAEKDNKRIISLETTDQQLSFLESMGDIEPNLMVNYTLRDLDELPKFVNVLKTSWREGDIEKFTTNSSIAKLRKEFPDLYDTIVVNRNNNWMSTLTQLTNNAEKEFVLVGTLHLNGREGVLNQLKTRGFSVEQL